jgi:dihydroneopterin triphosphate diphosphatase
MQVKVSRETILGQKETQTLKKAESVLVVIYARSGEVLLLQRRDKPDFWQSVTGSLEAEETPLQAAVRELWEETGLRMQGILTDCQQSQRFPIIPPWQARYAVGTTHNLEHVFRYELPLPCAIQLNPAEHLAWRWLDKAAALNLVSSYTNSDAISAWVLSRQDIL